MKLNKKTLLVIISIILVITLILLLNRKNNILCELNKNSIKEKINVELNKKIIFTYNYKFDTMDETVDKYDSINSNLKRIKEIEAVHTNIEQIEKNINYSINIDLTKVKDNDYKILNITEIIKLKEKKEIIEYYEKQGFTCEVI